jgi:hypothetical protein
MYFRKKYHGIKYSLQNNIALLKTPVYKINIKHLDINIQNFKTHKF